MSLISFFWPLLAPTDCSDPGQGQMLGVHGLGQGPGWGLLPLGLGAGGLGWQAGLSCPTSLCQAALPSDTPTSGPPPAPSPQAGKGSDV